MEFDVRTCATVDAFERRAHDALDRLWATGWQPAEVMRVVPRHTKTPAVPALLRRLVAVDHAGRPAHTLHPRWHQQIRALDLPDVGSERGWLATHLPDDPSAAIVAARDLVDALVDLGPLPRLVPPPGGGPDDVDVALGGTAATWGSGAARDPVLERVRALLAKAESTEYPAEAEAFTAKAHELMTRHAIDAAVVDGHTVAAGWVAAVRIPIDDPYLDTKSLLLHVVSKNTRCRSVHHTGYAMATVVGASADLGAVEVLFTSLLLQAQQALLAEGASVPAGSRQRSRAYRSSFLTAYAYRLDERLASVSADVTADVAASSGVDVLPVLADRRQVIDDAIDELFGELTSSRRRIPTDPAGWASGRRAADRARLRGPDLSGGVRGAIAS
jgi:hypothetical protein